MWVKQKYNIFHQNRSLKFCPKFAPDRTTVIRLLQKQSSGDSQCLPEKNGAPITSLCIWRAAARRFLDTKLDPLPYRWDWSKIAAAIIDNPLLVRLWRKSCIRAALSPDPIWVIASYFARTELWNRLESLVVKSRVDTHSRGGWRRMGKVLLQSMCERVMSLIDVIIIIR